MSETLLEVHDLCVDYRTERGPLHALRRAMLTAKAGEVIGIVGESGSGKSTLAAAIINLLDGNARVASGSISYRGQDILALSPEEQRKLRGAKIAMVFQDPMTSFSPVFTIGEQLVDFQHQRMTSSAEKKTRALDMLGRVGLPDAVTILGRYPHELSGGMRQRAAIAAALLMEPDILIADEPTTALDVTMEAQIIHLLRDLRVIHRGAIIVVTHHLGVVAELCDRVYVMYAGETVEEAPVDDLFHAPLHPYTRALLDSDPAHSEERLEVLPTIAGRVPDLTAVPPGCSFAERCISAGDDCRSGTVPWTALSPERGARCLRVTA
jgi:peptide/nickel transport system ATP-binding protein